MANAKARKKTQKKKPPTIQFRFQSAEHHALVKQAADLAGLSINGWMVQVTLDRARQALSQLLGPAAAD